MCVTRKPPWKSAKDVPTSIGSKTSNVGLHKTAMSTGISHVCVRVRDLKKALDFYDEALEVLGIERLLGDEKSWAGYGTSGKPFFAISLCEGEGPVTGTHVAFLCKSRDAVDKFYHAAIAAGGKDFGPPGLRPDYHESYYGGFVLDPDGNNIEATNM